MSLKEFEVFARCQDCNTIINGIVIHDDATDSISKESPLIPDISGHHNKVGHNDHFRFFLFNTRELAELISISDRCGMIVVGSMRVFSGHLNPEFIAGS